MKKVCKIGNYFKDIGKSVQFVYALWVVARPASQYLEKKTYNI